MTGRLVLGGVGVLGGLYGALLLLQIGLDNLVATVPWLVGGVLGHDVVLSGLLLLAGLVVVRLVPGDVRAPVVAGLVVLGTVTATAVPVLGRFGARPDNPTLLDRSYGVGWLVFAALVVLATVAALVRQRRRVASAAGGQDGDVTREPHDEQDV